MQASTIQNNKKHAAVFLIFPGNFIQYLKILFLTIVKTFLRNYTIAYKKGMRQFPSRKPSYSLSYHFYTAGQKAQDALESAHQDVSVTAEFNIDRITIIQGFSEILQNIPDYFVLVEPDAVFKMKIQAAVVRLIVPTTAISSSQTKDFA